MNYEVVKSGTFLRWLSGLRDKRAQARIIIRIDRVEIGNFGDRTVVILLCGGDKSSQQQDVKRARQMASEL